MTKQFFDLFFRCQPKAERGGTAAGGAQPEGLLIAAALQITCHKTGHHAVACAHAIHDLALGAADAVHLAVLIHQQSAVPGHAHQYVPGTLFLQGAGGGGDLFVRFQLPAHDLAQLVIVGLDQEGR